MKVIIAGSRDLTDKNLLLEAIKDSGFEITEVVCGNASGMDSLGREYAEQNDIDVTVVYPNWKKHGKAAGHLRNKRMAEYAEALICVHHETAGSQDMVRQAKEKFLIVFEKIVPAPANKLNFDDLDKVVGFGPITINPTITLPSLKKKKTMDAYEDWMNERIKEDQYKKGKMNFYKKNYYPKPIKKNDNEDFDAAW